MEVYRHCVVVSISHTGHWIRFMSGVFMKSSFLLALTVFKHLTPALCLVCPLCQLSGVRDSRFSEGTKPRRSLRIREKGEILFRPLKGPSVRLSLSISLLSKKVGGRGAWWLLTLGICCLTKKLSLEPVCKLILYQRPPSSLLLAPDPWHMAHTSQVHVGLNINRLCFTWIQEKFKILSDERVFNMLCRLHLRLVLLQPIS